MTLDLSRLAEMEAVLNRLPPCLINGELHPFYPITIEEFRSLVEASRTAREAVEAARREADAARAALEEDRERMCKVVCFACASGNAPVMFFGVLCHFGLTGHTRPMPCRAESIRSLRARAAEAKP